MLFTFISYCRKIMNQKWCLYTAQLSQGSFSEECQSQGIIAIFHKMTKSLLAKAFKLLFSSSSHSQIFPVHFICLSCERGVAPWQPSPQVVPPVLCSLVLLPPFSPFSVLHCVIAFPCLAWSHFPVCPLSGFLYTNESLRWFSERGGRKELQGNKWGVGQEYVVIGNFKI